VNERYLLDASAVLASIADEPGADRVQALMASCSITPVNLAEVVKKLREKGVPLADVREIVSDLQIPLEAGPTHHDQAIEVGELAAGGRAFGLSTGDSVCLAVAGWSGRIAVTAERRWMEAVPTARKLLIR
jgi:PIN domain nuclease of toxin-antitoxin system